MRATNYLFFIETKDGKTIYAVRKRNDVYHTVDIYEDETIKQNFTIANGTIEKALEYGIYTYHKNENKVILRKDRIINNAKMRQFNIKENSVKPSKA